MKIKKTRPSGKLKKASPRAGKPIAKKPSAVWDQAAQWYDALVGLKGSEYQKAIIFPGASQLMDLKKGDAVLDLACGQGVYSRYLSQRKMRVTGLDTSEEMIRFARSRSDSSIRFEQGDAQDPEALQGKTFDAVVCLLALQNIESLPPVMHNVKRWLKPGGRFVMVVTHPCFRIPRQTHWGWDEQKKIQYRRVDLYGTESAIPILTPPFVQAKSSPSPIIALCRVIFRRWPGRDCVSMDWKSGHLIKSANRASAPKQRTGRGRKYPCLWRCAQCRLQYETTTQLYIRINGPARIVVPREAGPEGGRGSVGSDRGNHSARSCRIQTDSQ